MLSAWPLTQMGHKAYWALPSRRLSHPPPNPGSGCRPPQVWPPPGSGTDRPGRGWGPGCRLWGRPAWLRMGDGGLGFLLGPFPGANTWPGCDGPFLPRVQIAPAALTGCPGDKGWQQAPAGPGGGRGRPGPPGGAERWEACRHGISSAQGCDSLGLTNGPKTQCPKRTAGRGHPGGAGGRGPVTSPPLQNMNHPHTRPAPNPGPTMQQKRAGREALASPAQLGTQLPGLAPSSPVWLL